jgi:PAS domain S-box-containing protein
MEKQLSAHRGGHLEALLNACPDAVIAINAEGIIKFANKEACKITEREMNELIGESIVIVCESLEAARENNRRIYQGGGTVHNFETKLRTKSGKLIPVRMSASHLKDSAGNYIGGVGYFAPYRPWAGAEAQVKVHVDELEARLEKMKTVAAPVFELYPGLSLVVVVGQLDAERFDDITANLLKHVDNVKTRVVLIDLSSAIVKNGELANRITRALRTLRLLGVTCVMAGMQASLARALEPLIADLGSLKSFTGMGLALREAFNTIGYEICARD